jgi:hypothetical protein
MSQLITKQLPKIGDHQQKQRSNASEMVVVLAMCG